MQKEKLYYTLKDIREEIYQGAVSIATLQNMVHANKIPSVRIMSKIFIPKWWVDEQIAIAKGERNESNR